MNRRPSLIGLDGRSWPDADRLPKVTRLGYTQVCEACGNLFLSYRIRLACYRCTVLDANHGQQVADKRKAKAEARHLHNLRSAWLNRAWFTVKAFRTETRRVVYPPNCFTGRTQCEVPNITNPPTCYV